MVMRSSILTDFNSFGKQIGLDSLSLLDQVGIDKAYLEDAEMPVSCQAVIHLYELAAAHSGLDDFGIRLAEASGLTDFGAINLILRIENTVRDALHALINFFHLYSDAARLELHEWEAPVLTVAINGKVEGNSRQIMDASIAQLTKTLRWLINDDWSPESVCFSHSRPAVVKRHAGYFRCSIDFLHEYNGIVLRKEDLDRKLPLSLPILRQQVERYLKALDSIPTDSFANRIAKAVADAIPRGEAHAEDIARQLNITRRTLNRRLAKSGLNFSDVLANAREKLAMRYLSDPERPISDIAGLVGFNSVSAFSAWFRHRFGTTATEWRREHGRYHH
ncbi:MAG: AraC family transcriptional regulator [Sphingobium sp.]